MQHSVGWFICKPQNYVTWQKIHKYIVQKKDKTEKQ
jgi:hypothetical protein